MNMNRTPDSSASSMPFPHYLLSDFPDLPPFLINTFGFFRHFILFFLLPIALVVFSALVAAALARRIHRRLFARYATPEELFEDAVTRLKNGERRGGAASNPRASSFAGRERALETLRLVIRLRPDMMKAYSVLATELFYGDLNNPESGESDKRHERRRIANKQSVLRVRRRAAPTTEQTHDVTNNLSPALIECEAIVSQGLRVDGKDQSLLKLQNELKLINQYGRNGAHVKMMNVGSFGWTFG